jgi:uncharacterized protein (DUF1800 family)
MRAVPTDPLHDPAWAWAPYKPAAREPWDSAKVAHLHRRAGFAASWPVLQRDLRDGPDASISRLLEGESKSADGTPAVEFESAMDSMTSALAPSAALGRIRSLWLYRMIFTPHPLLERMTLFWHGHFATSDVKVQSPLLMQRQNSMLRAGALGDFRALVTAIGKDPAMLVWLDATVNRKAMPNENYAREVMELFTLGRGHYTEHDVREAARAFTGWFVVRDQFEDVPREHDVGAKTVLGRTGPWTGNDIPRILLDQPSCARFICRKLFRHFVSDTHTPSDKLIEPLAAAFRDADFRIARPIELILRSNLFYHACVRRRRVKSPVEFAVGTIRALEIVNPTVGIGALADACGRMGQHLFEPPSVAGWDGGLSWINSTALLARANLSLGLLSDADAALGQRSDPWALARRHGFGSRAGLAGFYIDLLAQDGLPPATRQQIEEAAANPTPSTEAAAREVVRLILSSPEYQLA